MRSVRGVAPVRTSPDHGVPPAGARRGGRSELRAGVLVFFADQFDIQTSPAGTTVKLVFSYGQRKPWMK